MRTEHILMEDKELQRYQKVTICSFLFVTMKTHNKLYFGCLMLAVLCLGHLLLETGKAFLSTRQVSALPGELLLQLG